MRKINDKLFSWASIIDDNTLEQAKKTASMPFVYPHLALMPDAHLGKGATVGSVIATRAALIPAAVGLDGSCGMEAIQTDIDIDDLVCDLSELRRDIESVVPVSAGKYNKSLTDTAKLAVEDLENRFPAAADDWDRFIPNWRLQLGTLGSGNHFIELSRDESYRVWTFLHSGSRGVGNKIAQRFIKKAQHDCDLWHIQLPDPDLAYLPEGTDAFYHYEDQLRAIQEFAEANRAEMTHRVLECLGNRNGSFEAVDRISCNHNYTSLENHWGQNLYITRKGAIKAAKGVMGLIPGSMGDKSYVVSGLGNPVSFNSAPHGAGRNYSRTAARKTFSMEQLEERMRGIEWKHSKEFLDEIPDAYKPIDTVMNDAADLVKIEHTLKQIINVKGD